MLWGAVQGLQEIAEYALLLERNAKIPHDPLRHLYRRQGIEGGDPEEDARTFVVGR